MEKCLREMSAQLTNDALISELSHSLENIERHIMTTSLRRTLFISVVHLRNEHRAASKDTKEQRLFLKVECLNAGQKAIFFTLPTGSTTASTAVYKDRYIGWIYLPYET